MTFGQYPLEVDPSVANSLTPDVPFGSYNSGLMRGRNLNLRTGLVFFIRPLVIGRSLEAAVRRTDLSRMGESGRRTLCHPWMSARRYVYVWADGVYLQARMEANAECMLVVIGATPEGKKELVGFQTGVRESAQSWRELLVDIKQRGLEIAPDLAIGKPALAKAGGALGFWKAIDEVFPGTRHQRCWVHKTANVLNKVALAVQVNMKADLREIYGAPTRAAAEAAIDAFADKYGAKYDKAVACLTKDRERLLTFFDFPAEHWDHLRTSNPIESVFATVRHRTVRTKGSLSPKTACLMVFKLVCAAAKTWRRLKGENQLPKVVRGIKFHDGVEVIEMPVHHAA